MGAACLFQTVSFCNEFDQTTAVEQNADTRSEFRACTKVGDEPPAHQKTNKKHSAKATAIAGTACVETKATTLTAQERMQAFVRNQKWDIGDEEINETVWSFSVQLTGADLLTYAEPESTTDHIDWRHGKALVVVKSFDLPDGYTRTVVTAHFEGYGEAEDKFAPKRSSWTLVSRGKLEATLAAALRVRK